MSIWRYKKGVSLKTHIIQFAVVLLFVGYIAVRFFIRTPLCTNNQASVSVHPLWKIDTPNSNAVILWEYPLTLHDKFLAASESNVAFYRGNSINACDDDAAIIALDAITGKEVWRYPVTILYSLFGFKDSYLISSCCTSVTKLDQNGKYLWKTTEFPEKAYNSRFMINDNRVYFSSSRDYILDFETGTTLEQNLTLEERTKFDLQYLPQYGVYLRLDETKILAFQISTGLPAWDTHENFKAIPIILNNMVITLDQSNTIKLLDVQTGKQLGEIQLTSKVTLSPNDSSSHFTTLAAFGNTLFMLNGETAKLIAIKLD